MDGKRLFLLRNLTIYPTLWNCLLQVAECNMRPLRKENFVNDLPVAEVLWIFPLQFIDIVGYFYGHRLKAYIPALLEARTLLYGCKRLG